MAKELDLTTLVTTPFSNNDQKVEVVEYNHHPAIHLEWDADKKNWAEFGWQGKVPSWDNFSSIKITITVQAGKTTRPLDMMPRITDSEGEVFPLCARIMYDDKGQGMAEFRLPNPYQSKRSWLSNPKTAKKNEVLDIPLKLTGIAVNYLPKSGKGEIYITKIDIKCDSLPNPKGVEPQKKNQSSLRFDIITGHPARVVTPATVNFCYGVVFNPSEQRMNYNINLTIKDLNGNLIGEKITSTNQIGANSRCFISIKIPEKFGIYYVDAEIESPDNSWNKTTIKRSFVYLQPSGHDMADGKNGFRFGVQIHPKQDPATWIIEMEACKTIGIKFVRSGIRMDSFHPRPNCWLYSQYDAVIDLFLNHGIKTQLTLNGSAAWAAQNQEEGKKHPRTSMPRLEVWREFCAEVFRHFGNRINSFEIWNEPDLETFARFSVEEYQQLAEVAYKELNRLTPHNELMSAGFCTFTNKDNFHEKAIKRCEKLFKVHCFHGHGTPEKFQYMIDYQLIPMRNRVGINAIPWYAHETALTATGYGEKIQAEALFKKLIFSWSRGSVGYTWYDLRNDGFDPFNPEHNYGLLTNDYYPKAAYAAYNTLTSMFGGNTKFEKDLSDGRGLSAYQFRRDNDTLVAIWQNQPGITSELSLKTDSNYSEIIDLQGNSKSLKRSGNLLSLTVTNDPVAVRLNNSTRCEIANGILAIKKKCLYFRDGKPTSITLDCANPLSETIKLNIEIKCPDGISVEQPHPVILSAGENKSIEVKVQFIGSSVLPDSTLLFMYQTSKGQNGQLSIPVNLFHSIPKEFTTEPFAVINRREQAVDLFEADPGNVSRLWKGQDDLSARIWVAGDDKIFKLRIEAIDDKHCQQNRGKEIWKGDSIQIFCHFPAQNIVWQFGCALHDDQTVERSVWYPERGFITGLAIFDCNITRADKQTVYNIQIPWSAFGIPTESLREGFHFNIILNDNDSNVRESWIQLAPGAGAVINPDSYPVLNLN